MTFQELQTALNGSLNNCDGNRIKAATEQIKLIREYLDSGSDIDEYARKALIPEITLPTSDTRTNYQKRTETEHNIIRKRIYRDPKDCPHLKSNFTGCRLSGAVGSGVPDYNVSMHTFIDGRKRIRCNSCGTKWWLGKSGWEEALKMVKSSTNRPSSAEQAPNLYLRLNSALYKFSQAKWLAGEVAGQKVFTEQQIIFIKEVFGKIEEQVGESQDD